MENKKINKTKSLQIQQRDMIIFRFLDRVGYANLEHIVIAIVGSNNSDKDKASVLRRLHLLRKSGYVKVFKTHLGNYYALDKKSKVNQPLLNSIKLDQLEHHNFLTQLFLYVQTQQVISEREVIAQFKVVGKKGKVPDMIINDWIIEFERSSKNNEDTQTVVFHWTIEQSKNLCVIYENEEIKNRYTKLLNPRVRLLAKEQYKDILTIINGKITDNSSNIMPDIAVDTNSQTKVLSDNVRRILDKYR